MLSLQILTNLNFVSCSSTSSSNARLPIPRCSLRCQEISVEPLVLQSKSVKETFWSKQDEQSVQKDEIEGKGDRDKKEISGIRVPRQKYISVSKKDLLEAILSMFESQKDINEFLRFSACLDSILHAEHKEILEEMRSDYSLANASVDDDGDVENMDTLEGEMVVNGKYMKDKDVGFQSGGINEGEEEKDGEFGAMPFSYNLDWSFLFGLSVKEEQRSSVEESSVAVATRFQRSFMKLLRNAQFEELSPRDLLLTSALNTDYLLTLPIYVDWKRASESNAIIFRRGYATERQKGLLIVEKLDYLQSTLLQRIFFSLSKPLGKVGMWIKEAAQSASQTQELEVWVKRAELWLKEPFLQQSFSNNGDILDTQSVIDQLPENDLPIWIAAQKAVPRYEGLLSSIGPRGRLLRKLLIWTGLIPSTQEISTELDSDSTSEIYLRPTFLSRVSLGDIWRPATKERCGNDLLKMFRTAISILFSQSILQEPAFQELILLYTEEIGQRDTKDKAEVPPLKLKIYERIPIPDLPVIFPHKKLSFRILDTVRLDAASIVGLLAFFVNYKFEDIRSSPSAIFLDVIAISALIFYVTRIALGYKQTRDRYQLLVNKRLYEKTLASGFGSVHFLLDASEQQQYKEAILVYAVLLQAAESQVSCHKSIAETCEKFMYNKFKDKVEMPVDKAVNTLLRLGLVQKISSDGNIILQALPCPEAYEALKQQWDRLLG